MNKANETENVGKVLWRNMPTKAQDAIKRAGWERVDFLYRGDWEPCDNNCAFTAGYPCDETAYRIRPNTQAAPKPATKRKPTWTKHAPVWVHSSGAICDGETLNGMGRDRSEEKLSKLIATRDTVNKQIRLMRNDLRVHDAYCKANGISTEGGAA